LVVAIPHSQSQASGVSPLTRDGHSEPISARRATSAKSSLLYAEDVAAIIGMTRYWVYAETRAGRIPHLTLGRYYRYRPESIDAWLREIEHSRVDGQRYLASRP
jgi:predicted DNA-binding transcriptional regulator AlpA